MKKHKTCKKQNVKIIFVYYKTFKKEKEALNLIQQSTSLAPFTMVPPISKDVVYNEMGDDDSINPKHKNLWKKIIINFLKFAFLQVKKILKLTKTFN